MKQKMSVRLEVWSVHTGWCCKMFAGNIRVGDVEARAVYSGCGGYLGV